MSNVISLIQKKQEARVDSRILAEHLDIQHKNVLALIDESKSEFEEFGPLAFETRVAKRKQGGGTPIRHALLNEDQSIFLLTLTRNTERTKRLKAELVKAFSRFRKHQQTLEDYLPFYHELHDNVTALSDWAHLNGSKTEEKWFHSNFNRLINKAFGLTAGQRSDLPPSLRAKVTAINVIASDIIQQCLAANLDHQTTFQKVKQVVLAFAEPIAYSGST